MQVEARVRHEIMIGRNVVKRDAAMPYRRGGLVLTPAFDLHEVDEGSFAELQADPWVDIRDVSSMGDAAIASARRRRVDALQVKINSTRLNLSGARERYHNLLRAPEGSGQRLQASNARTNVDQLEQDLKELEDAHGMALLEAEDAEEKVRPVANPTPVGDAMRAATPSADGMRQAFGGQMPGTPGAGWSEFEKSEARKAAGMPTLAEARAAATPSAETLAKMTEGSRPNPTAKTQEKPRKTA